ncbi:MAG: tetratricopeptide repeat protein [Acidobacteria bacterium]|nr:tetratricopeptide repeat protein [Acidobacteriota bacterium]
MPTAVMTLLAVLAFPVCAQEEAPPKVKYESEMKEEGCGANLNPEARSLQKQGLELFFTKGKTAEGVALLEKAVAAEPRLIPAYVQLGMYYALADNAPKKSVTLLQAAVGHCPKSPRLHVALAQACAADKQHQEAVKNYHQARELGLELSPSFFQDLGNSHAALSEWDKAIENFQEALKRDEKNLNARRNLAIAYYRKGDKKKAVETAQEVEKLDPNGKHGAWARFAISQMKDD